MAASRWSGRTSPPAATSACPPPSSPAGPATPKAVDEQGEPIDGRRPAQGHASPPPPAGNTTEPLAFITDPELFGDLAADERFTAPYLDALNSLHDKGSRATLQMLVG